MERVLTDMTCDGFKRYGCDIQRNKNAVAACIWLNFLFTGLRCVAHI